MATAANAKKDRFASGAEEAAAIERAIQQQIDRKEKARKKVKTNGGAMQAGARSYPEPPFPKQHHPKPGEESDLEPAPMYDAPNYKGSEKLKGKVALITVEIPVSGGRLPCCSRAKAPTSQYPTSRNMTMPSKRKPRSRKRGAAAS